MRPRNPAFVANTKWWRRKIKTTKDIIIPAGTEVRPPPTASTRWGKDFEIVVHLHNDLAGYLSMDVDEALALGVLECGDTHYDLEGSTV